MADLSLEDQNFAERQTELIAEHDPPDDFVGSIILEITNSHFKRTRPSVVEPGGRVKRRFSVTAGCSAR